MRTLSQFLAGLIGGVIGLMLGTWVFFILGTLAALVNAHADEQRGVFIVGLGVILAGLLCGIRWGTAMGGGIYDQIKRPTTSHPRPDETLPGSA